MAAVSVIIPAYNVESSVAQVVTRCNDDYEVIVVDDGSGDGTYEAATSTRATVLSHQQNQGKGRAMRTGSVAASGDILVFIDADLQHLPEDIPRLVAPIEDGRADLTIGSRIRGPRSKMPLLRRCSNTITSGMLRLRTRKNISDSQSGFRAIRKEAFDRLPLNSDRFAIETEMLICAARHKLRIEEVPVDIVYRGGAFHFSLFDILNFLRMVLFKWC
jgi:glycosyltransferase involved in cell wall biosynthesis